jgi:predicted nucleic acid-binding protein
LDYFKEYFGDRTITKGELKKEDFKLHNALRYRGQLDEAIPKGGYRGSPSPLDYFKEYFGDRTITKGELKKEDLGLYSALRYHNQLDDAVPKELPFEIGGANILSKWMKRKRGKINKKENLNPLVHEVLTYLNYALISNNLPIYQLCINAKFEERNGKTTLIHTPSVMDIAKMNKRILEEVIDAKCYCHITKRDIKEFVEQLERYSNGTTTNLRLVFNSLNTKEKELLGILPESISFSVIEDIEKKLKDEDKQLYFLIKEKISKDNSFVYSIQYAIKEAIEQKNGSIRTELRKSLKNSAKKSNLSTYCFVYHGERYYLVNRVANGNSGNRTKNNSEYTTNGWKVLNKSLEYRILPTGRHHIRVVGCSGPGSFATNEEMIAILGYRKESV